MKINCKKIACLLSGIVILGMAGFSACCHAQQSQAPAPVQGVCESPHGGPITPIFQDVKQIYLLWDYKAEQPELLSEPLREEALKKEVLAYMQTYLIPCSKSKEIKIIRHGDNEIIRDKHNLIVFAFWIQGGEMKEVVGGQVQAIPHNRLTFKGGFYRAGSYMTTSDISSIANSSIKIDGESKNLKTRIYTILSNRFRIMGEIH